MENIRLQKLPPMIRDQDLKVEGMRQIMEAKQSRHKSKMEDHTKAAYDKTVRMRSLKHDFSTGVYLESAPGSVFTDTVASLQDDGTGNVLHRVPTKTAMEMGRKARADNVQRIIDLLV